MTVFSPQNWKVITNTSYDNFFPNLENDSTKSFKSQLNTVHQFQETKPISTYVFAFAAGEFEIFVEGSEKSFDEQLPSSLIKLTANENIGFFSAFYRKYKKTIVYVRKSQAEKFKPHAEEVFRLNREAVKYFEDYFDYKFPFPKYDLVLIPEFPFGGMEHAGATFLRESSVIFPTEPTANDYISRAT